MVFFSKVEDTFLISGRGLVIVPAPWQEDLKVRATTPIQLRTPDGRVLDTHIKSVEILFGQKVGDKQAAFLMPNNITKEDVPNETEIWLA
jgi:hypothetical protein